MATTDRWGCFDTEADTSDLLWKYRFGGMASVTARGHGDTWVKETPGYLARLQGGEDPDALEIVLERMAWFEGTVRDEAGNPLPAFPLKFRQWDDGPWVGSAFRRGGDWMPMSSGECRADPRGRYSYRRISPGRDMSIEVWPDVPDGESAMVRVKGPFEKGGVYRADVVVPGVGLGNFPSTGPWVLSGVALDDLGRPVQGARPISGYISEALDWPECTLADGSFGFFSALELSKLRPGEPIDTLWTRGYLECPMVLTAVEIDTLRLTGRLSGMRLTMNRTAALEVRVVDESGVPVEGAHVAVTTDPHSRTACLIPSDSRDPWPPDTVCSDDTDGRGEVRLEGLDAGAALYLLAWADGRTPTRIPLEGRLSRGESTGIEVVLPGMRQVPLEIAVEGWTPGVVGQLDDEDVGMDSGFLRMVVGDGPHVVRIWGTCGHELLGRAFIIPRESQEERVSLPTPPCERCRELAEAAPWEESK